MKDPFSLLLPHLRVAAGHCLLAADENLPADAFAALDRAIPVISNRFDVAAAARSAGLEAHFSDFDFAPFTGRGLDHICYRISKEKAVVHHIINSAMQILKPGGSLLLTGAKNEGIKTYAKQAAGAFATESHAAKHGDGYLARIDKPRSATSGRLDDRDYHRLRVIGELAGVPVLSKPGLFGWDKFDEGSAFLGDYMAARPAQFGATSRTLLDLGCGYGYLSMRAHQFGFTRITATDNCAAALVACRENFRRHGIAGEVIAGDAGDTVTGKFDVIVCNPPFHRGFAEDRGMTDKFLASCRRLLNREGCALLVVNRFVPLERLGGEYFDRCDKVAENRGFKLVLLR